MDVTIIYSKSTQENTNTLMSTWDFLIKREKNQKFLRKRGGEAIRQAENFKYHLDYIAMRSWDSWDAFKIKNVICLKSKSPQNYNPSIFCILNLNLSAIVITSTNISNQYGIITCNSWWGVNFGLNNVQCCLSCVLVICIFHSFTGRGAICL